MDIPRENLIPMIQDDIKFYYTFEGKSLGEGSYGIARKALRNLDGQQFAVKVIPKRRLENQDSVRREIALMK